MERENKIKEELLQQTRTAPDINKEITQWILAKDTARVKRMKWITIISWSLVVILFIVLGIFERNIRGTEELHLTKAWLTSGIVVLRALILVSVFFTVSFYVRSRTLSMKQIQARLSKIEEELKNISTMK